MEGFFIITEPFKRRLFSRIAEVILWECLATDLEN